MTTVLPQAAEYARLLAPLFSGVRERGPGYFGDTHWTERHLQCVWFDARLRPGRLVTTEGEAVVVVDPGRWNLEAGPDFLDAVLRVGPEQRHLTGDVEVHVRPADWDAHRHGGDTHYQRVVAHVTYHSGATPGTLPPGALRLPLTAALAAQAEFCFDDIDLAAYPHAILPVTPRPCGQALADRPDLQAGLLDAAGEFRLQAKARRLRGRLDLVGDRRQVFYEEIMAALGYKQNAAAFRRLALTLPIASWDAAWSREDAYARLLGAARLLPSPELAPDAEAARFVRQLWDAWWHDRRAEMDKEVKWVRHGLRPQNSPVRRLAAAAAIFSGQAEILTAVDRLTGLAPARWHASVSAALHDRLAWPFWQRRLTLTGRAGKTDIALVGDARLAAIVTNVIVPLLAAENRLPPGVTSHLPPEDLSAPMRAVAHRLFGRDHNPALYAGSGLRQQGLLQIDQDFCLRARTGCEGCSLGERLRDGTPPAPAGKHG
jgi:hypothetical protein